MKKKNNIMSVRFDNDNFKKIQEAAYEDDRKPSDFVRKAVNIVINYKQYE